MSRVKIDIYRPGEVEVAVEALSLDELFYRKNMRRLESGQLSGDFGAMQLRELGHVEVGIGFDVAAVASGCPGSYLSRFEHYY
jgi:hypothetical protein